LVVCSSYTTARRQHAANDETARWLFEKSGDLDFSNEEQTDQTITLQKEFNVRKPSKQVTMTVKVRTMCNMQQETGDHTVNLMEILTASLTL
jgi:hypothetical protein